MNTFRSYFVWVSVASLLFSGCASKPPEARVHPGGPRTTDGLTDDFQNEDFQYVADKFTTSLLASGALDKVSTPPAAIAIGPIVNNTSQHFDSDVLILKIGVILGKSGKAKIIGPALPNQVPLHPEFILQGKTIAVRHVSGEVRAVEFIFQLSLQDTKNVNVWQEEVTLKKETRRVAPTHTQNDPGIQIRGKPLEEWLEKLTDLDEEEEATKVLRANGPKVVPYLIRILEGKDSRSRQKKDDTEGAEGVKEKSAADFSELREMSKLRDRAVEALQAIGPAAKPAIPVLIRAFNDDDLFVSTDAADSDESGH